MEGFSYSSLVPNAGGAIQSGLQTGAQLAAIGENQRAAEAKQIAGDLITQGMGMSADDFIKLPQLKEFAQYDPSAALELVNSIRTNDKSKLDALRKRNDEQTELTASFKAVDPTQWRGVALQIAQQRKAMGDEETAAELLGLANAPPDQQKMMIESAYAQSLSGDELFKVLQPQGAKSNIGQLQADRAIAVQQFGEGSPQVKQFDAAINKATKIEGGGGGGIGDLPADKIAGIEKDMRGEVEKFTDEFRKVEDAYDRLDAITSSAGQKNAAADIALVYSYMKMLDPGSVVREGEFATAQNAGGLPTSVVNTYNKLLNGEFLTADQVKSFKNQSTGIYKGALTRQEKRESQYTKLAKQKGIAPENIILRDKVIINEDATTPSPTIPQPSGVKFLGFE